MSSEQTSGALSGAAKGASAGAAFGPWGAVIGGVIGGVAGFFTAPKKAKYEPLDINKMIADARTQAANNYKDSFAIEAQYNPQQAALRGYTNNALKDLATGNTPGTRARDSLLSDVTGAPNSLLSESADSILANLRLGGSLPADVRSAVTRSALQTGGQAGLSGSWAGRGLVARDLGLTSLSLQQQRQQQALAAGQALSTDALARFNAAQAAAGFDANRTGLLAGIVDSRALPVSGLDPASVASLQLTDYNNRNKITNQNIALTNAQNKETMDSLLGFGSALSSKYGKAKSTAAGSDGIV